MTMNNSRMNEHGVFCGIVFIDTLPEYYNPPEERMRSSLLCLFGIKGEDNGNGEKKIGPRPKTRTAHHKGATNNP